MQFNLQDKTLRLVTVIYDFTTCTINDRCVLHQPLAYLSSPVVPQSCILNHLQCCQSWLVKVNLCEQCPGCPYLTPVKHWVVSFRTLFVRILRPTDSIISRCNRAFLSYGLRGKSGWTLICFCFGPYNHCLMLNYLLSNIHRTTSVKRKYLLQILNKLYLV